MGEVVSEAAAFKDHDEMQSRLRRSKIRTFPSLVFNGLIFYELLPKYEVCCKKRQKIVPDQLRYWFEE